MIYDSKEFLDAKEKAVHALLQATDACIVDPGIIPLLALINETDAYYTTSSCAGRILIIELPMLGDKKNAVFLGCWHRKIHVTEIQQVLNTTSRNMIWFLAQAPIIHIFCRSLESADLLVKLANSCGFKNSSIRHMTKKILVEVASTERLDTPLMYRGENLFVQDQLGVLVDIANEILQRSEKKIKRFETKMKEL